MRFFLRDRSHNLSRDLDEYRARAISYRTLAGQPRVTHRARVPVARQSLEHCDLRFLFRYDVFPRSMLKFYGEWQRHDREMRVGDTIVQQAQIPPGWGFHVQFGVRLAAVYREPARAGFCYATLEGHPEQGSNEFSFEISAGSVVAIVRTTAGFGLAVSQLLAPVFTRPYVRFCNRAALARMSRKFREANP